MIATDYQFCFNNYLTRQQQGQFANLSKTGQSLVKDYLLSSGDAMNLERVRLLLSIMPYCQDVQATADKFFQSLLISKDEKVNDCLKQTLEICEKGACLPFFQCAETKLDPYYSAETLIQMTASFHALLKSNPSFDLLSPCLGYREGGKELLERLRIDLAKERALPAIALLEIFKTGTLKESISRATSFLTSLPSQERLGMEIYLKFFQKLQQDPVLKGVNLFEILKLALLATTGAGKVKSSLEDLWTMALEAARVHASSGKEALTQVCGAPGLSQIVTLDQVIYVLRLVADCPQGLEPLAQFSKGKLGLSALIQELEERSLGADFNPDAKEGDLEALMQRFAGNDCNVAFPLSKESLETIKEQYRKVLYYCWDWSRLPLCTLVKKASTTDDKLQLIAIGRLALRHIFRSIYLHNTQVLTVLGLLLHPNGCMAQVKTGEGKTMIVNLQAFVLSKLGKQVHIMSSSRSLAERDQKSNASFFLAFGFPTSHICEDQAPAESFQAPILYGTATDFEFALMREMLYRESLFMQKAIQGKRFANVAALVDEGDNQTIDTADHDARLSYPAEVTYDWVYRPIVAFIELRKQCQGLISPLMVRDLRSYLMQYRKGQFQEEVSHIPDEKLKEWMQSAYTALYDMKENVDYVISSKAEKDGSIVDEVVIIDYRNTGEKLESSRWSKGLHECLEAIHASKGKRIEAKKETLTPISLSRSVLFPMYGCTYFLTGTAGSKEERDGVKKVFGIDNFDVPTFRPSKREDKPPIILATNERYYQAFIQRIQEARGEKRPFLGLFETIHETHEMEKQLQKHGIPYEILNEMQLKDEEEILEKAGHPGKVLIATNTAGRGTDIKLVGESRSKGLKVIFGYYPRSYRVEMQGRGRAGRQGEPGSTEILLSAEKMGLSHLTNIENPIMQAVVLAQLSRQREEDTARTIGNQAAQATLKRHIYTFVQRFFAELEAFMRTTENERFFNEMSTLLNNRRLKQKRSDPPAGLKAKDRVIAQEALRLLSSDRDELANWKSLIKSIVERMRERAIHSWSLNFYQAADEMMHRPAQDTEKKMTELFNKHKPDWDRYLEPSGKGLLTYLREVTGVTLITI